jgi:hypothetical protein
MPVAVGMWVPVLAAVKSSVVGVFWMLVGVRLEVPVAVS